MPNFRTDLASERIEADSQTEGIRRNLQNRRGITVESVKVLTKKAAETVGKPCGEYVTLYPEAEGGFLRGALSREIAAVLLRMVRKETKKNEIQNLTLLAVGLGNREITADSFGVKTAEKIRPTRQIREEEPAVFDALALADLSVLIPGVAAQSGMDAADRVASLLPLLSPDAILVFDAIVARSWSRVGNTVQIADTGIEPGSGIGNRRKAISARTFGIPVIAVGVPTVCDTETIVRDALSEIPEKEKEKLLRNLPSYRQSYVSRCDGDAVVESLSDAVADAVNRAFGIRF